MALRRVCQKYQFLIRGRTVTLEKDFIWGRHIIKHCRLYVKKKKSCVYSFRYSLFGFENKEI